MYNYIGFIINPSLSWGNNPVVQGDSFKILGYPDPGTFSDYIVISKKQVFEKPEQLSHLESATIPLSGLTAYRALFTKARLRAGEKVLITGVGGGAALWAFQFALAYKARVYVTSGSEEKLQKAKELGALGIYNYKDLEWTKKAAKEAGGFDIVIDSAGGEQFSTLPDLMINSFFNLDFLSFHMMSSIFFYHIDCSFCSLIICFAR